MPALPLPAPLTYDDYLLLPEDGNRHEIIEGDHWMSPAPNTRHQQVSMELGFRLRSHLHEQGRGQLFAAPCDVILSEIDVVQPDLIFIRRENLAIVEDRGIFGAPDLLVEILSESTRQRDLVLKRKLYERFGVEEYWVVDPEAERVEVYRRTAEGRYSAPRLLSREAAEVLESPVLPGLSLPLAKIFS